MTSPRLSRLPYLTLIVGSLASTAAGVVLTLDKTGTMQTTLTDGTATGIEVYAGQAWVTFGGALVTAGLIGLVLSLALASIRGLFPAAVGQPAPADAEPSEPVEPMASTEPAGPSAPAEPAADEAVEPAAAR